MSEKAVFWLVALALAAWIVGAGVDAHQRRLACNAMDGVLVTGTTHLECVAKPAGGKR